LRALGIGAVHKVLTRMTYIGGHRFNTKFWKMRERKPGAAVVEMAVPPIIDPAEFEAVQTLLRTRMLQNGASAADADARLQ
jgi:hypothetical protein